MIFSDVAAPAVGMVVVVMGGAAPDGALDLGPEDRGGPNWLSMCCIDSIAILARI